MYQPDLPLGVRLIGQSVAMPLSDFEKKVALLLMEGRQPDAIADTLGVSVEEVLEATEAYDRWAREGGPTQP
jgi:hypothetical protein